MAEQTVYFLLDQDGYPVKSSLEPFDGAQEEPASGVAERAKQYHRAGKPARFNDDTPPSAKAKRPK